MQTRSIIYYSIADVNMQMVNLNKKSYIISSHSLL